MKVCVVGSGGREHALATVLGRNAEVVVTPGNAGIEQSVPHEPEAIDADLFVVGPEVPLVGGLADRLRAQRKLVFGPGADGAQLEGSKAWMKQLLNEARVPTARHASFTELAPALAFLDAMHDLFVIKTDGLAAGKGVLVTTSREEARDALQSYLSGEAFGDAGRRVVIEEGLTGPEASLLVVTDGTRLVPLAPAQDFKRVGEGDTGPNTGGIGAYSPVPDVTQQMLEQIMATAVEPTLHALQRRSIDYRGVLFAGLMLTPEGPKVLEYNVRFGDPETQVVLPRFESDACDLLAQAAAGRLRDEPRFDNGAAVTVFACAEGYPADPRTGDLIHGIEAAKAHPGVDLFFAGVKRTPAGLVTAGGRVLAVTARAANIEDARRRAYAALAELSWRGMHFRRDIAAEVPRRG